MKFKNFKLHDQEGLAKRSKKQNTKAPTMKDTAYFSWRKAFRDDVLTNATVSLGNSYELPVLFKRLGWRLLSATTSGPIKFASRLRRLSQFGQHLLALTRKHGAEYTVMYLKASQLAVQKCIAGSPLTTLSQVGGDLPFPRLDRSGLPRVIPAGDRALIRQGVHSMIRWWLTLFSIYRVIKIPGTLKLGTITDKSTAKPEDLEELGAELAAEAANLVPRLQKPNGETADLLFIEKASPSCKTSWTGALFDAMILRNRGLSEDLLALMDCFGASRLKNSFLAHLAWTDSLKGADPECVSEWDAANSRVLKSGSYHLGEACGAGQLSVKEEPAGKVRVFALVDVWTQSILKPLHDSIFSFLRRLPNDATFDQRASVRRCIEKVGRSKASWGYDLSAATDRLPVAVQEKILSAVIGEKAAHHWRELLVGREYILKSKEYGNHSLWYAVGQPMGALSSWAMLALTHHLVVQLAYRKSRSETSFRKEIVTRLGVEDSYSYSWYNNYELLGDDIVIFDQEVATAYLTIMARLGVEINLSKSVIANTEAFEFAKVTGYKGVDVSALPWKAFISQNTMLGRVDLVYSLLGRQLKISNWVRWFTQICKHRKYKDGDKSISVLALWTMFANKGKISYCSVLQSVYNLEKPTLKFYREILLAPTQDYILGQISRILRDGEALPRSSKRLAEVWNIEEPWFKVSLSRKVLVWKAKSVLFGPLCPDTRALVLSREIVRCLCSSSIKDEILTLEFNPTWTEHEQLTHSVWLAWYGTVKALYVDLSNKIGDQNFMQLPIDNLIEINKILDRLDEVDQLLARAKAKATGAAVANVARVDSPLRSIKTLLAMRQKRPGWTYAPRVYHPTPIRKPWPKDPRLTALELRTRPLSLISIPPGGFVPTYPAYILPLARVIVRRRDWSWMSWIWKSLMAALRELLIIVVTISLFYFLPDVDDPVETLSPPPSSEIEGGWKIIIPMIGFMLIWYLACQTESSEIWTSFTPADPGNIPLLLVNGYLEPDPPGFVRITNPVIDQVPFSPILLNSWD